MSSYIGPRSADVPVGTIATKGTVSANALVIGTNNATIGSAVYVAANGSVGVACTTPLAGYKFTVNGGNIRLQNTDGWIAGSNSITFYGDISASYGLTVTSSGNTGIGTTAPSFKLDVRNGRAQFAPSSEAFAIGLRYNDSTNGVWLGSPAANSFQISNAGGGALFNIDGSGNVGIGTVSPTSKLYVYGGSITAGTNSSTGGSIILQGLYGSGSITNIGTEYSTGGPVIGYGVTPSTSVSDSFVSSSTVALSRAAYTQSGSDHKWFSGINQTVAVGSSVTCTEKMRLDGNGYLIKPYQPSFHVNSGAGATSAGNVIVFTNVITNISSSYNNSTGRFTAPVAGTYLFIASYLKDGGNTDTYCSIRKNGSAYANMDCTGSSYTPGSMQAILTLAAGDYVDVYVNGGTVYVSYRQFTGFLIG